jgi:hypothetical protein
LLICCLQEIDIKAGGGKPMTMGEMCRLMLTRWDRWSLVLVMINWKIMINCMIMIYRMIMIIG